MGNGDLDKAGCEFGREVRSGLGELSKKIDVQHVEFGLMTKTLERRLEKLERTQEIFADRLQSLEKRITFLMAVYTVLGAILGWAGTKLLGL